MLITESPDWINFSLISSEKHDPIIMHLLASEIGRDGGMRIIVLKSGSMQF
ncbi:MAG: hypothetical protein IPN55_03980 [Saprospiraceae bacterium]|nr:hypothetical protein [Candidatus Brachybacter algidus]